MKNAALEMSEKLRVKIEHRYKDIYDALRNHAVGDFHELFFLCACLGKKSGKKVPLKKSEPCFWSNTIIQDEWYAYYGIYLHDHDMNFSCLGEDAKVIDLMQQYANGGMAVLIEDFLHDYVKEDSNGHYIVDCPEELPKELLAQVAMDWSE